MARKAREASGAWLSKCPCQVLIEGPRVPLRQGGLFPEAAVVTFYFPARSPEAYYSAKGPEARLTVSLKVVGGEVRVTGFTAAPLSAHMPLACPWPLLSNRALLSAATAAVSARLGQFPPAVAAHRPETVQRALLAAFAYQIGGVEMVMSELSCSRATAYRYVRLARQRGLILDPRPTT